MTTESPDEITFKVWPITVVAKGKTAIQAIRKPIFVLLVSLAFCLVALGMNNSRIGGGWFTFFTNAYVRVVGSS